MPTQEQGRWRHTWYLISTFKMRPATNSTVALDHQVLRNMAASILFEEARLRMRDWRPNRVVVIEFENFEQAKRSYHSAEYQAALPGRFRTAVSKVLIVEGPAA